MPQTLKGREFASFFRRLVMPERRFYQVAMVYGVAISLLTLAVPVSVQMLINTVANTAIAQSMFVIVGLLAVLLAIYVTLYALQLYMMELFERQIFARISAEVALTTTHADLTQVAALNRSELINRFFEIIHVQKSLPPLIVGGFALALQTLVGLVVVSFYHPFLFVFNLIFVGLYVAAWRLWHGSAMRSVMSVSKSKYKMAGWLEELSRMNGFFKSERRITSALRKTNLLTEEYLTARKAFFGATFAQIVGFLALYVLTSATLLGLGGWLVINGQLTLGQLVAAELILSAIFAGVAKSGYYITLYYELCAAAAKLDELLNLPQEQTDGRLEIASDAALAVEFQDVKLHYRQEDYCLNLSLPAGAKMLVKSRSYTAQKLMTDLLLLHREPEQGQLTINGYNACDYAPHGLRERIAVVESPMMLACSIREYFLHVDAALSVGMVLDILKRTGLEHLTHQLPEGLDTTITPTGYPLTQSEQVRLKLALALASQPRLLVLTQVFDAMGEDLRERLLADLCADPALTLIYFSHREDVQGFSHYALLEAGLQQVYPSLEARHHAEMEGQMQ